MNARQKAATARRWVIKVGSALLTNEGRGLNQDIIQVWAAQMANLCQQGKELILVSSGSVAEGMKRLQWTQRPTELFKLQAAAAVGQMGLIQAYESCFQNYNLHTAQILLTHEDLSNRTRYLNARSTLTALVQLGVIPVVNENDTVVTDEIRFGDNDTLAGLVANLVGADLLVILTDQQGLCESNPRENPNSPLISEGHAGDPRLEAMASAKGGALGRGGMATKLQAAKLAARSGTMTLIASGRQENVLLSAAAGETIGTLLLPNQAPLAAHKQWLASHLRMRGQLYLDDGAVSVLRNFGKSLLAVGVTKVEGKFMRGDMVACVNSQGQEIARGLINYNIEETFKIMGQSSEKIASILGYVGESELIHRDNLVLV